MGALVMGLFAETPCSTMVADVARSGPELRRGQGLCPTSSVSHHILLMAFGPGAPVVIIGRSDGIGRWKWGSPIRHCGIGLFCTDPKPDMVEMADQPFIPPRPNLCPATSPRVLEWSGNSRGPTLISKTALRPFQRRAERSSGAISRSSAVGSNSY
jgi:hypothetical protein